MNRRRLGGIILFWIGAALGAATATPGETPLGPEFLRDLAATRSFRLGHPTHLQPTPDGRAVLFLRSGPRDRTLRLYQFEVESGRVRELVTPEQVLGGAAEKLSPEEKARRERMRVSVTGFTSFELSPNGTQLLLSLSGRLYVLDRPSGVVSELPLGSGDVIDPKLSPDGRSVAFVRDYDLWVHLLGSRRLRRVTTGGTERRSHALAEFVAQEEMGRFSGYWWSPRSDQLVYQESDATTVEVWSVADPANPDVSPRSAAYPRPGKANVEVRLGIVSARGGKTTWLSWDRERYPYLTRVDWHAAGGLTLVVQTREQQDLAVLKADPKSGRTSALLTEHDPAWLNLDQGVPQWLEDGSGFLWTTERTGVWRLELRDARGGLLRPLTDADQGYRGLLSLDSKRREAYVCASADPTQSHLYRVGLSDGRTEKLSDGAGLHSASFARDHSVFVHQAALSDTVSRTWVRRRDGTMVGEVPSVAEIPPFLPRFELTTVGRERSFHAALVRPRNFESTRRYPVIVDVYGGPQHNSVSASMSSYFLRQWLADQGFIVAVVDGRGTPGRGRDWERAMAGRFGTVPLEDQVAGLLALGERYPELDVRRAGIVGWSFGGYMSALAVLRRPDVFSAGVAGAPVVDWLDYDTHYTEHYLGLPDRHPEAYTDGSLLTYAAELRRPLLLVHGTADDNVYFRHSLRLADALFRAGRDFEMLPLAGLTHMVPDPLVTERLWTRVVRFFHAHLGQPE